MNNSNQGVTIGEIKVFALGFAEEILLVTDCPKKAQRLLNICQSWALENKMALNTSKCKVMVLNGSRGNIPFKLSTQTLQTVDRYKYVGVTFDAKRITNVFKTHFTPT